MKIVSQKIGAEGQIEIDLVGGSLQVSASETTPGVELSIAAKVNLPYYLDQGAQKVGSPLVQSIAALLEGVLKNLP